MKEERGKRKEERGKRKEERGKRKEERGKRKEEKGKRKKEKGKRKKEEGRRKKERGGEWVAIFLLESASNAQLLMGFVSFINQGRVVHANAALGGGQVCSLFWVCGFSRS